jgi:tRNA-specific 2-thiouridylase
MLKKTVVVGMSGGVDSSVTALLLKEEGYKVIGIFMKNWEEEDSECPAYRDYQDVVSVAAQLEIPYYSLNFSKEYWENVFSHCLKEFEAGYTPNPDILCNREIKFKLFFQKALSLGADYIATGHYCRNVANQLGRGRDPEKDQSYFLYTLKEETLRRTLFPIGDLQKREVRALAEKHGLSTASKKDSTGICFIGKRDFPTFLSRYIPRKEGEFRRLNGEIVGKHQGASFYTIGQRRGLGVGGEGEAWYVVDKDSKANIVYLEQGEDHPALYANALTAVEESWVGERPQFPFRCTAKLRYRAVDVPCTVSREADRLLVTFDSPQKAITPRQSVVFYDGEICLGGAMIERKV